MGDRILVIGGTGLLGQPVATHLKQAGYDVRLMVRDVKKAAVLFGEGFDIVQGDIADEKSLKKAMDGCFGIHINLSGEIEQVGVENISSVAASIKLQRITYI